MDMTPHSNSNISKSNKIQSAEIAKEVISSRFQGHWKDVFNATVLISALGYFVDMFDISLFAVVRSASLNAIGIVDPAEVLSKGITLLNVQNTGMLVGGIVWGILGDRRGRISVLFGSIALYSLANIANAFVTSYEQYLVIRFIAGFGLAGELGAAITLVSESLPKESRGLGTTVVATLGLLGSVCAALVGQHLNWKLAYMVGGFMGLALLVSRAKLFESGMFAHMNDKNVSRGNAMMLFKQGRLIKYLACIAIGIPIYFITGLLFSFGPELVKSVGVEEAVTAGNMILYGAIGLSLGDLLSGLTSQLIQSRKKAVGLFMTVATVLTFTYLSGVFKSAQAYYFLALGLGICGGYWAVLVTVAAEQFGTNIRSTVATSVPNFVRASVVISSNLFLMFKTQMATGTAAMLVAAFAFGIAFLSLAYLKETFGKNLDYIEK